MNEAGDEAKERSARQRKAKLLPHVIGVLALRLPVARAELPRQLRADFRVPALVDAVQDSGELRCVGAAAKQAFKAAAECRTSPTDANRGLSSDPRVGLHQTSGQKTALKSITSLRRRTARKRKTAISGFFSRLLKPDRWE